MFYKSLEIVIRIIKIFITKPSSLGFVLNVQTLLMISKLLPEIKSDEIHHMAVKLVKNNGNEIEKI